MSIKLGSGAINKVYLGSTEINKVYLGSTVIYEAIAAVLGTPILSNFRVENAQPTRVVFDASASVAGMTSTGFTISGKTISSLTIDGDGLGGYFTVSSAFTFWDNNTIRLESGDGTVYDFTMEHIVNNISEPTTTNTYYVTTTGGTGAGTEGDPWSLSHAFSNAPDNSTVWVKAGSYGSIFTTGLDGGATTPVKFIGYTNTPGDITTPLVDTFDYVNTANANSQIDPAIYPVLDDNNTTAGTAKNLYIFFANNLIFRNIQVVNAYYNVYVRESTNIIFDNVTMAGAWESTQTSAGSNFDGREGPNNKIRVINSVIFDGAMNNIQLDANYSLVKDNTVWSGNTDVLPASDYYIVQKEGSHSIIKDNECTRVVNDDHGGHGIGVKADQGIDCHYNLICDNTVNNIGLQSENLFVAFPEAQFNVFKRNTLTHNIAGTSYTGLLARNGAQDNIFEQNYVGDSHVAIMMWTSNTEMTPNLTSDRNIFKNNIFDNFAYGIAVTHGNVTGNYTQNDNLIYNNTFYNSTQTGQLFIHNFSAGEIVISGNEFKNNIVSNIASKSSGTYGDSDYLFEYNNFDNCGFANPSGTGNVTVASNFVNPSVGNFEPQATFTDVDAPRLSGVNYDYASGERIDPTTIGAVKHASELPTPDTTAPTLVSATINNGSPSDVVMVFDEPVTITAPFQLGFSFTGTTALVYSTITGSGTTWTGVLESPAAAGETILLSYSGASEEVEDDSGNFLGDITNFSVTNNISSFVDLFETGNAASIGTEANALGSWRSRFSNATPSVSSTEFYDGSYSIKGVAAQTTNGNIDCPFTAVIGKQYRFTFRAKRGAQGTNQAFASWQGVVETVNTPITTASWAEYVIDVTADATTIEPRVYCNYSAGATGDEVYVDACTVEDITP